MAGKHRQEYEGWFWFWTVVIVVLAAWAFSRNGSSFWGF